MSALGSTMRRVAMDLARVSSIVATTEEAVNLQQRPLHPDMVVKEVVEW